jgi:murein biosynthesis integral membrane protein MurJ
VALAVSAGASFLLGFARDMLLAREFGASHLVDALFLALVIPVFIENIFGIALRDAVVPHLQSAKTRGDQDYQRAAARLGRRIMGIALAAAALLALVPEFWLGLLAPGWSTSQLVVAEPMLRQGALLIAVLVWIYFQSGILTTEHRVVAPAFRPLFFNIGAIAALLLAPGNIAAVMSGMLIGYGLQLIWLQSQLGGKGIVTPTPDVSGPARSERRRFALGFLPVLGAAVALQVNVVAERFFASWLGEGSITFLSYAYRLAGMPVVLLSLSLLTAIYPTLVSKAGAAETGAFLGIVLSALHWTLALLTPVTVFLALFADTLITLLFARGSFSTADAQVTAGLVAAYVVGIPALGLGLLGSRALLARRDTAAVLRAALLSMGVTLSADLLLLKTFGAIGLALAASLGAFAYALRIWIPLAQDLGRGALLAPLVRWTAAGVAGAAALWPWPWKDFVGLGAAGVTVLVVTSGTAWLLGERLQSYRGVRGH